MTKSGLRRWTAYAARRLGSTLLMLAGVAVVIFVVTRMLGTPVYLLVGQQASEEVIAATIRQLGLDRPIPHQFVTWIGGLVQGDLGTSRHTFNPVTTDLALRLPATIELVMAALAIAVFVGVGLGVAAARRPDGAVDRFSHVLTQLGASMPNFWVGLVLVYLFAYAARIFPAPIGRLGPGIQPPTRRTGMTTVDSVLSGNFEALASALHYLALPATALSLLAIPAILQITRGTFIEVLASDYIRTAHAAGLSTSRIYGVYALRNAVVPMLTTLAMSFGFLISGTVLIEVVFAWPGIGLYAVNAMNAFDYEPIMAVVLLGAIFYALAYLLADLAAFVIDPRIREGAQT